MSDHEVAEQQRASEQLQRRSRETNTCTARKVFSLGSNGAAMVSCGLPVNHEQEMASETDDGIYYPEHIARQQFNDGSAVTFRWPL